MKKIEREAEYIASREPDKEARYYFGQIKDILNLIKAKQLPDGRFSDDEVCLFEEICHAFNISMVKQTVAIKQKAVNSDQEGTAIVSVSWFNGEPSAVKAFVESLDNDWTYVPPYLVGFLVARDFVTYARKAR